MKSDSSRMRRIALIIFPTSSATIRRAKSLQRQAIPQPCGEHARSARGRVRQRAVSRVRRHAVQHVRKQDDNGVEIRLRRQANSAAL